MRMTVLFPMTVIMYQDTKLRYLKKKSPLELTLAINRDRINVFDIQARVLYLRSLKSYLLCVVYSSLLLFRIDSLKASSCLTLLICHMSIPTLKQSSASNPGIFTSYSIYYKSKLIVPKQEIQVVTTMLRCSKICAVLLTKENIWVIILVSGFTCSAFAIHYQIWHKCIQLMTASNGSPINWDLVYHIFWWIQWLMVACNHTLLGINNIAPIWEDHIGSWLGVCLRSLEPGIFQFNFKQFQAKIINWWLGYLLYDCLKLIATGLHRS